MEQHGSQTMSVEKITHLEKPSHNDGVVGSRL
jgi:hypothetical protein